jgi:hypothetical protein
VVSFIGGGNQRKPLTCRKSLTNFITQCCIEYISPWAGLELTTLVVISTDCIGSFKSNCHTITTTRSPQTQLNGSVLSHVCVYLKTSPGITMYSQVKFACWLTVSWLVSHVKQEVLTLLEHLTSPSVFSWVRVARSIVMCLMFCRSLFVLLSFALSVLLFMACDYPCGIFKLVLQCLWFLSYIQSPTTSKLFSKVS